MMRENLYLAENRPPRLFYGYLVVLVAFFTMVVMWGTFYTFGVFFKPLSADFGWTRAMTSGAFSLYMILHGFGSIFAGRLNDRFGPRIVMTTCGFFLGLGYLLMSQISSIWQLYLFYGVIIAIGMSAGFVPMVSTTARWFVRRRGLMTGIVAAGIGAGTMIMPPVANWLISNYEWRISYTIISGITLVLVVIAAQFLRRDPSQMGLLPLGADEVKEQESNLQAQGFSFREAIHARQFWMLGTMLFCLLFGVNTVMVHIVNYATDMGISAASATSILTIIGGLGVAGRIIMGSATDRIGTKKAFIIGFILMSVALFWLMATKGLWMFYLFAAIFGFGYGGLIALQSIIVAELFGLSSVGEVLGGVLCVGTIGGAIGPLLAGHIFDITHSYQLAFLICVILCVVGTILTSLLRPVGGIRR